MSEKRMQFACDWAALTVFLHGELKSDDTHIVKDYSGTNVWERRQVVFNEYGDKVFTLLSKPKSTQVIRSNAGLLEIANQWLYHGGGVDAVVKLAKRLCPMYVKGFSRLDLAVDFNPSDSDVEVINALASGEMYVSGKRHSSVFYSVTNSSMIAERWRKKVVPHCHSWGSKVTDVKWKLYYKSKELLDANGGVMMAKPYIVDNWRINGLKINDVWRLEVSISRCSKYLLFGDEFELGWIGAHSLELFCNLYNQRFLIRRNQGHSDRSNDDWVPFLNMGNLKGAFKSKKPKSMLIKSGRVSLLRALINSLDDDEVLLDKRARKEVIEHVRSIVKNDGLAMYFKGMTGMSIDGWCYDVDCRAAGVIINEEKTCDWPLNEEKGSMDDYCRPIKRLEKSTDGLKPNYKFEYDEKKEIVENSSLQRQKKAMEELMKSIRL